MWLTVQMEFPSRSCCQSERRQLQVIPSQRHRCIWWGNMAQWRNKCFMCQRAQIQSPAAGFQVVELRKILDSSCQSKEAAIVLVRGGPTSKLCIGILICGEGLQLMLCMQDVLGSNLAFSSKGFQVAADGQDLIWRFWRAASNQNSVLFLKWMRQHLHPHANGVTSSLPKGS